MPGCKISIEIDENKLMEILVAYIANIGIEVSKKDIQVLVKSKQNYKSEWENAHFKATVNSYK